MWCLLCTHRHTLQPGRFPRLVLANVCHLTTTTTTAAAAASMFSPIFAADLRTRVRTLGDARIRIRMRIRLQFEAWQNISIIYRLIPVKHLFRFFALSTWPTAAAASLVAIKSNLFVLFYVKTHGNTS